MPDIFDILFDGSVGRELADVCHVEDGHLSPALLVFVSLTDIMLRLDVGAEILEDEVAVRGIHAVSLQQAVVEGTEELGVLGRECTVDQLDQHLADLFVGVEDFHGVIAAVLLIVHDLIRGKTEDKGILFANFFYDLDVGAVHGSQSHRAVEHELHVACARCFFTGCGNLLRDICCSDDDLGVGYFVILDEDNLDLIVDGLIIVDDIGNRVDQLDGQLGSLIACGRLGTEDECMLGNIQCGILLDLVIQIHDMQDVQELTFVFVETFYLNVEDGSGIDFNTVVLQDIFRKADFVLVLDVEEFLSGSLVIRIDPELSHAGQVSDPLVADMIGDPVREQGVAVKEETPLRDAVGLVVELVREHLVEVLELTILEDLSMESGNTVDAVACHDRHIGHADLLVVDNAHAADLVVDIHAGIVIGLVDLALKSAVDLLNDLIDSGQQL